MRPKETGRMKRRKMSVQKEKEREKRREKDERKMKTGQKKMKGGCTSANATEILRHASPKTTRLFSTARMFGANARFSAHSHNNL